MLKHQKILLQAEQSKARDVYQLELYLKASLGLIYLKYLVTDKMGAQVVKSELDTFKGPYPIVH